ncbi:unnamed protein product [Nippostrongylus brasiliensis]|uniref:Secreted protein n=1 Tax=Nippostrongylus brasiliensis TaxID=27835 RepID=A0A0N4YJ68_NIPBR|nr:unnamed protein product [Nippostrongylus brasiliensis]
MVRWFHHVPLPLLWLHVLSEWIWSFGSVAKVDVTGMARGEVIVEDEENTEEIVMETIEEWDEVDELEIFEELDVVERLGIVPHSQALAFLRSGSL